LRIAPVKALATISPDRVFLDTEGVAEDRRLFLVHADGAVVTQRRHPRLTGVVPDLDLAQQRLTVTFPDGTTATSELSAVGEHVSTTLFGKDRAGRVVPGAVADTLSQFAGVPMRLVLAQATGVGWDEGPVSLIAQASVQAAGPPAGPGSSVSGRFRMLLEVDGTEAYAEDSWVGHRLVIGDAVLRVTHPLERCVVINHSPVTGRQDWPGLKTLVARRGRVTLGVIADVEQPGGISVGDTAEVIEQEPAGHRSSASTGGTSPGSSRAR
ncbi:MAG TPA: MOSC N-terminal beta barrel domain-containing protein, partial [Nocardioidaceae bacterium]|nr:MOSC N-terminal beta barrel domain-containing protein [Nocardioidaceae bacterium]